VNQSSAIFGAIFVAYFVFITIRGELPTYAGFLLSTPQGGSQPQASNTGNAQSSNQAAQATSIVNDAIAVLGLA